MPADGQLVTDRARDPNALVEGQSRIGMVSSDTSACTSIGSGLRIERVRGLAPRCGWPARETGGEQLAVRGACPIPRGPVGEPRSPVVVGAAGQHPQVGVGDLVEGDSDRFERHVGPAEEELDVVTSQGGRDVKVPAPT